MRRIALILIKSGINESSEEIRMKLLTLNTHSLVEENYSSKLEHFTDAIAKIQPDIIALQEVNQSISSPKADTDLFGYVPCVKDVVIREDNHILQTIRRLSEKNIHYYWTYLPIKKGYDKYCEGIAVMSKSRIIQTMPLTVSKTDDKDKWKTRRIIGVRTEAYPKDWFFSVHFGWWKDDEEPFCFQWNKTCESLGNYEYVWLMGDFNNPAHIRKEGYDLMKNSDWYDTFCLAKEKDSGVTVEKVIDGWREESRSLKGMRIDQIWCNFKPSVKSSRVIFNGKNGAVVSDHYGVIAECERSEER